MKLQGLIFDIDGTLVDTNELHAECWPEGFAYFGNGPPAARRPPGAVLYAASRSRQLIEGTTSKHDAEYSKPSPEIFEATLEHAACSG
ncbi:MAG TPA: HAD hydrolase-like protein [Thermoanaerobaculia bacterium]|nr:HAD hydrolase-like protein [Thermoanaerobaculia bacterium]